MGGEWIKSAKSMSGALRMRWTGVSRPQNRATAVCSGDGSLLAGGSAEVSNPLRPRPLPLRKWLYFRRVDLRPFVSVGGVIARTPRPGGVELPAAVAGVPRASRRC